MDALKLKSESLERLLSRLEALEHHVNRLANKAEIGSHMKDDAEGLIEELLIELYSAINLPDLERRFDAQLALDFNGLDTVCSSLCAIALPDNVQLSPTLNVNVPDTRKQLRGLIDALKTDYRQKSSLELRVAIDMKIGACVRRLLMCACLNDAALPDLKAFITSKLALLEDSQLVVLWAALQRELDAETLAPAVGPNGIVPSNWRNFDDPCSVREKYADYVVELKIRMMQRQQQRGIDGFPVDVLEVPDIATWISRNSSDRMSEQEATLQKCLARINLCASRQFGRTNDDFAHVLRISPNSRLLTLDKRLFENAKAADVDFHSLFYEMRKLAHLIDSHAARNSNIERALRQYKLGLEVTAPESIREIEKKPEVTLQRELAKFLVERGIYAVGTTFGRSETDLVSNERSDYFIIEVKKFPRKGGPNPGNVNAAIAQLQSYMDEHPTQPAGILVIFNLSSTFLVTPQQWIRGKYWVVTINLLASTPSHRRKSLSIEEGKGDATIAVHWLPAPKNTHVASAPPRPFRSDTKK